MIKFAIINADLSNRHPEINDSEKLANHIYSRLKTYSIDPEDTAEQHHEKTDSNILITVTEFHETASKLLLEKLKQNECDDYIVVSKKFPDDYISLYVNRKKWEIIDYFNADWLKEEGRPTSYKGIVSILKNENGERLFHCSLHFRRLLTGTQEEKLIRFKSNVLRKAKKYGAKAVVLGGDFNIKPEIIARCFKPSKFTQIIRSSETITTSKMSSIDNLIVNEEIKLADDLIVDADVYLTHFPLFGSYGLKKKNTEEIQDNEDLTDS